MCYNVPHAMPFDIDELDPDDPFEIDERNAPHLFKHSFQRRGRGLRIDIDDVRQWYSWGEAYFFEPQAGGDAHWIMICDVEGVLVSVPLAPPESGDVRKCRPIGLYEASSRERDLFRGR